MNHYDYFIGDEFFYKLAELMKQWDFPGKPVFGGPTWAKNSRLTDRKTGRRYRKIILSSQTYNFMTHDHRPLITEILKHFHKYQIRWEILQYDYINFPEILEFQIYFFTDPRMKGKDVDENTGLVKWRRDYCHPINLPLEVIASTPNNRPSITLSNDTKEWLKDSPDADRETNLKQLIAFYSIMCWSGQNY
jgi:hypothetical protein